MWVKERLFLLYRQSVFLLCPTGSYQLYLEISFAPTTARLRTGARDVGTETWRTELSVLWRARGISMWNKRKQSLGMINSFTHVSQF